MLHSGDAKAVSRAGRLYSQYTQGAAACAESCLHRLEQGRGGAEHELRWQAVQQCTTPVPMQRRELAHLSVRLLPLCSRLPLSVLREGNVELLPQKATAQLYLQGQAALLRCWRCNTLIPASLQLQSRLLVTLQAVSMKQIGHTTQHGQPLCSFVEWACHGRQCRLAEPTCLPLSLAVTGASHPVYTMQTPGLQLTSHVQTIHVERRCGRPA